MTHEYPKKKELEEQDFPPENVELPHEILQLILQDSGLDVNDKEAMSVVSKHWNEAGAKFVKGRLQEQFNDLIKNLDQEKYATLIRDMNRVPIFNETTSFSEIKSQLMHRMYALLVAIDPVDLIALQKKDPYYQQMIDSVIVNKKLDDYLAHQYIYSIKSLYLSIKDFAIEKLNLDQTINEPITFEENLISILHPLPQSTHLNNTPDITSLMTTESLRKVLPFINETSPMALTQLIAQKCSRQETLNELIKMLDLLPIKNQLVIMGVMIDKGSLNGKLLNKAKELLHSPECVLQEGQVYRHNWDFVTALAKKADKDLLIQILNPLRQTIQKLIDENPTRRLKSGALVHRQQDHHFTDGLTKLVDAMLTSPSYDEELFQSLMIELNEASKIIPDELRFVLYRITQDIVFRDKETELQIRELLNRVGGTY